MAEATPFLSIIVPFHNSAGSCEPLLRILAKLDRADSAELIFVDDGSIDDTPLILRAFANASGAPVHIVDRDNGGPGAARNTGLDRASGKWVWFVDSDDTIDLAAIGHARAADWPDVDLIAWEFEHANIRRGLRPGLYDTAVSPAPALDPVVANWFAASFLDRTGLRFPEYCIYEATPVEAFVLPLLVSSYVVSGFKAYKINTANASVTRGRRRPGPRFYDRLRTTVVGMEFGQEADLPPAARAEFEAAFNTLFLWYSVPLSRVPDSSWIRAARVMRLYRSKARHLRISRPPFADYPGRGASRLVSRLLWALSAFLPAQNRHFDKLRKQAWERPIGWSPPRLPDRWSIRSPRAAADEGSSQPERAGP